MSVHFLLAEPFNFWKVTDPVIWCLDHAYDAILERAKDGLLRLTHADDRDRIVRLVTRRCGIHFIEIAEGRFAVQFWVRMADIRPFCREHNLARPDIRAVLHERKHGVIKITSGAEFLYGVPLGEGWPVDFYVKKWERRQVEDGDDGQLAPASWSSFSWSPMTRAVPWAILKSIWRNETSTCPNCDGITLLCAFGWRHTFLNRYPLFRRICLLCRRSFDEENPWEIDQWLVQHLDARFLPSAEWRRDRLVPWPG